MCGSLEIDSAIDVVKGLSRDLAEVQKEAKDGKLLPLPGESVSALCSSVTMVTLYTHTARELCSRAGGD